MASTSKKLGIGGWLTLFVFWLTAVRPFMLFVSESSLRDGPQATYDFFLYTGLVNVGLGFLVGLFFFSAHRRAPLVAQIYLVSLVIWNLVTPLIVFRGDMKMWLPQIISAAIVAAIFIVPWIVYFSVSKRVKATYSPEILSKFSDEIPDLLKGISQAKGIVSGGDGRTLDQAIVIEATDPEDGVLTEYRYLGKVEGEFASDWVVGGQRVLKQGGRTYDELTIQRKAGGTDKYYFDITSFHGVGGDSQVRDTGSGDSDNSSDSLFESWTELACRIQRNGLLEEEVETIWNLAQENDFEGFNQYLMDISRRPSLPSPGQ